jgi:hypothetical protein
MGMHATLLIVLPVFTWLTLWQLNRALNGNTLSWAYTFEWPLFGTYAIYVWWQLIHDQPAAGSRRLISPTEEEWAAQEGHNQPGWALNGGRRKNVVIASTTVIDEKTGGRGDRFTPQTPEESAELARYNRYLGDLNAADSGPART